MNEGASLKESNMPSKDNKIKSTDNIKQVARETKRRNRLNSIKNQLEAGNIKGFDQIFAIISESRISIEMNISFYTLRKKITDPGEWTVNEMMRFAALIGVKYDVVANFILDRIKVNNKSKIFRE